MVILRDFTKKDFQQLIDWIPSKEFAMQWGGTSFTYPLTKKQLKEYIKGANETGSDRFIFAVIDQQTGQTVGHISIMQIQYDNGSGRVGRVLVGDKHARGQGYGQAMMKEIVKFGFEELGLHRISLGVFDFNEQAVRAYEKVGFVREGLFRDVRKMDETYWSLIEMSILEDEWYKLKGETKSEPRIS
ncbi:GNAT family N-acetyltransferase [Metabacillus iocasae]|uniref:RimJ/RimL family protein N-acetyltransferase n=1 Tax=Priestia iocasae TaxID=2291674 RepID=A0ABS2QWZ4_9BACI|nr:GNAT family protein [Metabacillus iocasae]MBM7703937.1 RimJ/RimL family protein N-acetyltransferase [Metabacillus iocasae]